LVVEDETGTSANISNILITVENNPPTAIIKQIQPKKVNEKVQISGADSSDKDGDIVNYIWTFGDSTNEVRSNDSQVEHTWKDGGTYTIELTVQDNNGGTDSTQFQITIRSTNEASGAFTEEQWTALWFGTIITIIIVVVIIIVVIVIIRSRESI
jgi:PKD repeat protein